MTQEVPYWQQSYKRPASSPTDTVVEGEFREIEVRDPDQVLTREERIQQLQTELASLSQGGSGQAAPAGLEGLLAAIAANPQAVMNKLQMDEIRQRQFKGVVAGLGSGLAVRYFGKYIGDQWAGALGGLFGGYAGKKLLG